MNQFTGQIAAIEIHGSIALIDVRVRQHVLTATLLGNPAQLAAWHSSAHQTRVNLMFNEAEVALAKNLSGQISLRNRMPSTILAIQSGEILSRIKLAMDDDIFYSVITTRSVRSLQLCVGDAVEALVKSNEMTIQTIEQDKPQNTDEKTLISHTDLIRNAKADSTFECETD